MKLFNTLDMDAVRTSCKQKDNYDLSYYGGKEPAFTPAVQGQVTGMNPNSGIETIVGYTMCWECGSLLAGWTSATQFQKPAT